MSKTNLNHHPMQVRSLTDSLLTKEKNKRNKPLNTLKKLCLEAALIEIDITVHYFWSEWFFTYSLLKSQS